MNKLVSRNPVLRFKEGKKIEKLQKGKRFVLDYYDDINKKWLSQEFDSEENAKTFRTTAGVMGRITDRSKSADGNVLKIDRTKGKDAAATAYGRQLLESNNNLSFKLAYQEGRKTGNKYFAWRGKVYKTDLENGKDNITEMAEYYGNNLGFTGDPKMKTKKSMKARAQYRKDIDTSEVGHIKEIKKTKAPYVSSYDGGELFANFMGLASPTRWAGAIGRASRGEGNTGTFVGKVLNNMLDPLNGARENQGIFSLGLVPSSEKWAAEHPTTSGLINGALDVATFGPKPKFTREFKFKPNYGWKGRLYTVTKEQVPMNIYEGNLNMSAGTALGERPFVELGKKVGETTKTVTRRKVINPGTRYVKSVTEKPTGNYNFSWGEGMLNMFPWLTAITENNIMK